MGRVIVEILKALGKAFRGSGGKTKPPTTPRTTPPRCTTNCAKLPRSAVRPNRRHDPCKTKGNDPTKDQNSMLDPAVDVAADMAEMNAGNFTRAGEDIVVNGRTYGWHPDTGVTFPKSGPGVVQLDRNQHQFIKMLNSGSMEDAMKFANNKPGLAGQTDKINAVLNLWKKCK
jgi:hypothetical protein